MWKIFTVHKADAAKECMYLGLSCTPIRQQCVQLGAHPVRALLINESNNKPVPVTYYDQYMPPCGPDIYRLYR